MNWWTSSALQLHLAPLRSQPSPKPAQRSIQLTGGLFDNSVPGVDLFSVAPEEKPAGKLALNAVPSLDSDEGPALQDMLAFFEAESPEDALLSPTSVNGSLASPDALTADSGMQFLEGFTNLDEYLFSMCPETPMEVSTVSTDVPMVTSTEGMKRKRTAEEAFESCASSTSVNSDHDDYVLKKPRRAEPTTIKVEKEQPDKDIKYRERRNKNNIASKRSRETRKQKHHAMEQRAIELEASNAELEQRVVQLEDLTKKMKDILVKRLSQSTSVV